MSKAWLAGVLTLIEITSLVGCGAESDEPESSTVQDAGEWQNTADGGVDEDGGADLQLQLVEVMPTRFRVDLVPPGTEIYTVSCPPMSVQGLEPGQEGWLDVDAIAGTPGSYLDGDFYLTLGCDAVSCDSSHSWWINRQRVELLGEAVVPYDSIEGPPDHFHLPDAASIAADSGSDAASTDAESETQTLNVYRTRTLTGRVHVSLRYWAHDGCGFETPASVRTLEAEFDLGE
jgi:hypothetical protein